MGGTVRFLIASVVGAVAAFGAAAAWALLSQALAWLVLFGDDDWPRAFTIAQAVLLYVFALMAGISVFLLVNRHLKP